MAVAKSTSGGFSADPRAADLLDEAPLAASPPELPAADLPADFETALAHLESLVQQLESGDMSLEDSLQAYRRGVGLVKTCQDRLSQAEQQVRVLEADLLRPLDTDDVRGDA